MDGDEVPPSFALRPIRAWPSGSGPLVGWVLFGAAFALGLVAGWLIWG